MHAPPTKPQALKGNLLQLPSGLKPLVSQHRWVVWRWLYRADKDKWTKVPYQPKCPSAKARSNDPATWADYRTAIALAEDGEADGIGFMLKDSAVAAFDVDDCRNPVSGEVEPWAWALINQAASYTEVTVSGTGLRIIGSASGPHVHRKHAHCTGSIETYRRATRFIVVTGVPLPDTPTELADIDGTIDDHIRRMDAKKADQKVAQESGSGIGFNFIERSKVPYELDQLIRVGAPIGKRSEQFHHAVGWLKDLGWLVDDIVELLQQYPTGIGTKYFDRLRPEIERSFQKTKQDGASQRATGSDDAMKAEPRTVTATPYIWRDPWTIPRREWLYGRHFIRRFVSATIAPGGVGKSSLLVADALAMVSGRPLLGLPPAQQLRVWIWNLEDPRDELARRIQATAKRYELKAADLDDRLFVDSGREQALTIATTTRSGAVIVAPVVESLMAELISREIDVLIIDPFVSCHQVSENDNNAMDLVVKQWGKVAERANCAIDLVHHTRKQTGAEFEVSTESSRGGKALTDACRSVRTINRMTKDEGERAGVDNHRLYFRTFNDKLNLAPPPDKSDWFRLQGIELGNGPIGIGDSVAVVVEWQWPDPLANVSMADLRAIQTRVASGKWRENAQAKNWVGHTVAAVLNLDTSNKAHRGRINGLLKTWIANGMFVVVTGKDDKGNDRPFVEVGELATD